MLKLLRETWEEILLLSSAGAGFWYALEPPIEGLHGIPSGLAGAVGLSAALGARAVLEQWGNRIRVRKMALILAGVLLLAALALSVTYIDYRKSVVFDYQWNGETIEVIRGVEYKEGVEEVKQEQGYEDGDLLNTIGGPSGRDSVWTKESIAEVELCLIVGYVLSLLFTLLATMLVVEVIRNRRSRSGQRRP